MKRLLICTLFLVSLLALTGCSGRSPYVNTVETQRIMIDAEGRQLQVVERVVQDRTGDVAANFTGQLVGMLRTGAQTLMATNGGQGYPADRQLLYNLTDNYQNWNDNWGTGYGYGGFGGGTSYSGVAPVVFPR